MLCIVMCSMVRECGGSGWLVAAEARAGSWRTGAGPALVLDWTAEHSPLRPGDRSVPKKRRKKLTTDVLSHLLRPHLVRNHRNDYLSTILCQCIKNRRYLNQSIRRY